MLVEESRHPAGPRGGGSKSKIDVEIELYLTDRLTALLLARFVGEETPNRPGDGSPYCWLVDPHDGTWAYLQGYRGSTVSVALLRDGVPELGIVCAPMSPDRGRDLIAWAEGLPHFLRNDSEVKVDLSRARLKEGAIVFLHHCTAERPVASGTAVAPARFVTLPNIAYRLARVATVSLGALVEFQDGEAIAHCYPGGVRDLHDGGKIGQALSAPADANGGCKAEAASSHTKADSQANGSLMRVSPIGIWARQPEVADRFARQDSSLTHPNEVCVDACGVFAAAIATGIRSGDRDSMRRAAHTHARTDTVKETLGRAGRGEAPEGLFGCKSGWVLIALQNAFFHLQRGATVEEALVATVGKGGDTDTTPPSQAPSWVLPMD